MSGPGVTVDLQAILGENWRSLEWRLDNLYWIVNKDGQIQDANSASPLRHAMRSASAGGRSASHARDQFACSTT